MGLLAKIKQMFSSNIVYTHDENDVVVLYNNKSTKLKVGSYIVIENDCTAMIAYRNNITDYLFGKGKYKVASEDMPKLFLRGASGKKEGARNIKVDLYFVNNNLVERFNFASSRHFVIRSRQYGRIGGQVEGICKLHITSPRALFDWLYIIKRKFKNGKIDKIIGEQIGNAVCRALEKSKIDIKDIVLKNTNINEFLNVELENTFEDLGFEIKDVYLKGIQFDAKVQDKIDAIISKSYESVDKRETRRITVTTVGEDISEAQPAINSQICSKCGKEYSNEFDFCPYCGNKNIK